MSEFVSDEQMRASVIRWALVTIPACVLLGFLSGQLAGPDSAWFQSLTKPAIFPDPKWFGIVWTILYVMMGLALALVCASWDSRGRTLAIVLFIIQFALNLAWSPVFFGTYHITHALIVIVALLVAVLATIVAFWRVRPLAGALLLPYLAWVMFATVLNYQFLQLNPQADGVDPAGPVQRVTF